MTASVTEGPLSRLLRRRIALDGPVGVDEYMALALGHPTHGYYPTRDPLGAAGDFTTAPEVSQMFGELLGLWCAEVWDRMGRPRPVRLVELGPGRGTLMADALRAVRRAAPAFAAAADLHLVETSPALRAAQARALADGPAPAWHDRLADLPGGPMLLLANEFVDALPVRQFQRTESGWRERRVGWDEGRFRFVLAAGPDLAERLIPPALRDASPGAVVEVAAPALALATELARRVAADPGAALIVDYGPARRRPGATLQAVRRHGRADPLDTPGEADLTVHVDFEGLAQAAVAAGAAVSPVVRQGAFLRRLGIETRAAMLARHAPPDRAEALARDLERLVGADQMGSHFKVLAIFSKNLGELPGLEPEDAP